MVSYRTGVLHTRNEALKMNLKTMSAYQAASVPTMVILKNIMNDHGNDILLRWTFIIFAFPIPEWFQEKFFPENHKRLLHAYLNAKQKFTSKGIQTTCSSAGFFFLADFRPFIVPLTSEKCHGNFLYHWVVHDHIFFSSSLQTWWKCFSIIRSTWHRIGKCTHRSVGFGLYFRCIQMRTSKSVNRNQFL